MLSFKATLPQRPTDLAAIRALNSYKPGETRGKLWFRAESWPSDGERGTSWYAESMALDQPTDISIRQLVADSGSVTRGLRQGRTYTLTLNGEPLARIVPIRRRRAVPRDEVLAIFATAPVLDVDDLRADLDEAVGQDVRDPFAGTGL